MEYLQLDSINKVITAITIRNNGIKDRAEAINHFQTGSIKQKCIILVD